MRSVIYLLEFLKNLYKYRNKKIKLEKLQVWVGQTCNLRCKNCSQLFPYIKHRLYDIDVVIDQLKKVLVFCEVDSIHIIGGEPFTNKEIYKLIEYICEKNPNGKNKIVSNGTIIPQNNTLNVLQKYNKQIFVTVSCYDALKDKQDVFAKKLEEYNITCQKICDENFKWFFVGDTSMKEIKGAKRIQRNFDACWDRTCVTIADGELSICPRMHNSYTVFKHSKKKIEHLPINKFLSAPSNKLFATVKKALIATCLTTKTFREACRYCYGVSSINNMYCNRGEQLPTKNNC